MTTNRDIKPIGRNHRQTIFCFDSLAGKETFSEEILNDWYRMCKPKGPGPLGLCRMLCAALEEIAELKGISLPKK